MQWGLVAIYLPVFNALTHIAVGLALRRYNPGLWTAIFLFLPFGIWSAIVVSKASHAGWVAQAVALTIAVLVHAAIMIHVRLRLRRLAR